jgi:hypothetical protein
MTVFVVVIPDNEVLGAWTTKLDAWKAIFRHPRAWTWARLGFLRPEPIEVDTEPRIYYE